MIQAFQHGIMPLLKQREAEHNPIRVGILGCGSMGGDLLDQIKRIPGMQVVAVADRRPKNIPRQLSAAGYTVDNSVEVSRLSAAEDIVHTGKIVYTDDLGLISQLSVVDVVVDATGKPAVGAMHGVNAMQHGKHLVMMNVEADVTIGALLAQIARNHGVVYSLGAGDEPSSTLEIVHFAQNMGFRVIAAGKGKNNPLDRSVTPADLIEQAKQKLMNPRVLSEFIDGTKTMVEMTALANATGLRLDKPGMHGLAVARDHLHKTLIPEQDGGVLSQAGVVEYSVGSGVAPGVFVVAHIDSPRLCLRMDYLALGEGPYYTFYRPYHLTSLEVPITIARAALFGISDMTPRPLPTAEACGRAKRDIRRGETLDGLAETCYYGWSINYSQAQQENVVPLGLLENAVALQDIPRNTLLCANHVQLDQQSPLYQLHQEQQKIC